MANFFKRQRGFTLIEIAVVLGIVLIVLSLGLTAISSQLSSASYSITKKRQDAIKEALIGYFGANKSLPCPYVPASGTAATGIAPALTGTPLACPNSFGTVPFATLGLAREIAEDGWGNLFSYQVFRDSPAPGCPGTGRHWTNSSCFGAGKSGGITVNDGTVAAPVNLTTGGVAVVISHGVNGLGGWVAAQGTRNAMPANCEEAHNARYAGLPGCTPVIYTYYRGESQANDDVVAYLTPADVLQPLTKQGTLKSATAQVNDDLQLYYEQAIALNTTTPASCNSLPVPSYDPWGNIYGVVYVSALTGSTNLICLYSIGGTGSTPTFPDCTCYSPAICRPVSKATVNDYRNRASVAVCP